MQGSDSPSSLSNSLLPSDAVLKPNATIEEKLYLLSVLVPKAENAKNRVADLHAKTLATIASCAPLAAQIKEVNKYAHLFFSQMTPQLATIDQVVASLAGYKPKILQLSRRLATDKRQLDEFTSTLAKLRQIRVHDTLKDYLLPELPPNEYTGTLADWANATELLNTHHVLATDLGQMEALREWGDRQIMKVGDKHKIVLEESASSSDILAQLAKLEVEGWLHELTQLQRVADGVLSECVGHFTKVSAAYQAKDVLALPTFMANDLNLATQLLSITKCRSRVNVIFTELTNASVRGEGLVAKLQALGNETIEFSQECRDLTVEFEHMAEDIESYIGPANTDAQTGFSDLQRSVNAWNEFIKTYDALILEIERRRLVMQQHRMIALRYQRELQALYDSEATTRQAFDETLQSPNIPPSWNSLEFLAEPPLSFQIVPNMQGSILPNLAETEPSPPSSAALGSSANPPTLSDAPLDTFNQRQLDPLSLTLPPQPPQHLLASSTDNSLLGSNFSLSESMLGDSHAVFHSAVDQQAQSTAAALAAAQLDPYASSKPISAHPLLQPPSAPPKQ